MGPTRVAEFGCPPVSSIERSLPSCPQRRRAHSRRACRRDTHWFQCLALPIGSAHALPFLGFLQCEGPESNWRHMVLQTIALPTELPRREAHFTRKADRRTPPN